MRWVTSPGCDSRRGVGASQCIFGGWFLVVFCWWVVVAGWALVALVFAEFWVVLGWLLGLRSCVEVVKVAGCGLGALYRNKKEPGGSGGAGGGAEWGGGGEGWGVGRSGVGVGRGGERGGWT